MRSPVFCFSAFPRLALVALTSSLVIAPESPLSASQTKELNLRYTYEISTEKAPMRAQRVTVYIKGKQRRMDFTPYHRATITQCDLQRHIHLDLKNKTFVVQPFKKGSDEVQSGEPVAPRVAPEGATGQHPTRKGGVVVIEGEFVDTGERREMFGLPARHVIRKQVVDAKPGSCHPGRWETVVDAWLVESASFPSSWQCPITEKPERREDVPFRRPRPDCQDTFQVNMKGDADLLKGFPLYSKSVTIGGEETTTVTHRVTDLSLAQVEASLFVPPADFKEMKAGGPLVREPRPERKGFLVARFAGKDPEAIEKAKVLAGAARSVEFVLDASNSMWGQIAGKPKIAIAREVIAQVIRDLPEGMKVGLRVYGHRLDRTHPDACTDSELLLGIGPLNRQKFMDAVTAIQPKGRTPLVYSVLQTKEDFREITAGERRVVLVSDGKETCEGDISRVREIMRVGGTPFIYIDVIGFALGEDEARKQLHMIAQSTGGTYVDAESAEGLRAGLRQAVSVKYVVHNKAGEEIFRGAIDGVSRPVPAGTYLVVIESQRPVTLHDVVIQPDKETRILVQAEGLGLTARVQSPLPPSQPPRGEGSPQRTDR